MRNTEFFLGQDLFSGGFRIGLKRTHVSAGVRAMLVMSNFYLMSSYGTDLDRTDLKLFSTIPI
jgi:hypothetical protein